MKIPGFPFYIAWELSNLNEADIILASGAVYFGDNFPSEYFKPDNSVP